MRAQAPLNGDLLRRHTTSVRQVRIRSVLAVLAAIGLTAGCSSLPRGYVDLPVHRSPAPELTAECPRDGAGLGGDGRGGAPTGSVPAGFTAKTVLVCRFDPTEATAGPDGQLLALVRVISAPVTDALLSALTLPDQAFPPNSHYACAAVARIPTYLLLVDGRNRAVRPVLPQDPCQDPRNEVDEAIKGLDVRQVDSYTYREHS